jgi:hypothetical protein
MTATVVDKMLKLLNEGFAPYEGAIDQDVYDRQGCRKERQARWFYRLTPQSSFFVCIGCSKSCALKNPEGFQAALPVETRHGTGVVAGVLPVLSDEELLDKKSLLTLPEVQSILRVKERSVRRLIDDGALEAHEGLPIRVYSSSIKTYLERKR